MKKTIVRFSIQKLFPITLLFIVLSLPSFCQVDLKKLDAYYAKALKDWGVPGMSVAIVKEGKVIFAKGYGVKEAGKPEKPDEHTLYAIASNSKAFTTAAIAQLVDEGKLSWDDKVKSYLPYFELYDPWVSNEFTIRDLLCHRAGLKTFSGDLIWYRTNLSQEEIIRRAKYLHPAYGFRSGYGYSNIMYITAGEVIKKITGKDWGDVIAQQFFQPLGMSRTISTTKDLDSKGNYATPHALINEAHQPIPWEDWKVVAATGGIISSASDMAQWMIFNLNNGIWKGDTLLSADARNEMWKLHNVFPVNHTDSDNATHIRGYGLGWTINDYYGRLRVGHTGGYSGMLSAVSLVPDEQLGVVVLTNGMKGIYSAVVNYTIDRFLNAPERNWSSELLQQQLKNKDTRIEQRKKARLENTRPTLSLEEYTGEFWCDAYGKISVKKENESLRIYFEHTPDFSSSLDHWHQDVFQIKWDNAEILSWFSFGTVRFEMDNNAKVTGIHFDVPNNDFWFEELDAKRISHQ